MASKSQFSSTDFGLLQVEKFFSNPFAENLQLENVTTQMSKRAKRNTQTEQHDGADQQKQFVDSYTQISNQHNQNIVGYVTPESARVWEADKQKMQDSSFSLQQFENTIQLTQSDEVQPIEQNCREVVQQEGVSKRQQLKNFNVWLKVVQQKLFQRAEQKGYGGQKAVQVSDNFRKIVLQGPQKTSKVLKDGDVNMVEYSQSVVEEYVDMLKHVYGEKLVLDPIVLPTKVLSCYNGVQPCEVSKQAADLWEKLHSIRITNKRFIIYKPDVKEGRQWEHGLWKIWDTFLEKAGNISIKQNDKVSRDVSSVSFNLNRTTWFDGIGRKVEAHRFVANLNMPQKIDPPFDVHKILGQHNQSEYKYIKIIVKGHSHTSHKASSKKQVSPGGRRKRVGRAWLKKGASRFNKDVSKQVQIHKQCLQRNSQLSSHTNFAGDQQSQNLQVSADGDFEAVVNKNRPQIVVHDYQNKKLCQTPQKRKFEDYDTLVNQVSEDKVTVGNKKMLHIPISNSGCIKSYLKTNKKISLNQAISIIRKVNRQVSENSKLRKNLRLYLTDGTIPLADDDDPGHRCVVDRMAVAFSKCRAFDTKRGESLSHFMMMESTGVASYTFFAPLAGISNLTAFHQETKKRRSFNLGANDFIVQPLMSTDNLNRVERVHGGIFGSHVRHQQLLPLEFYLEEDIPLVLHVRESTSMVELPEQSSHAFITFGDVLQAEAASKQTPSGLKVSCNDMDLIFEMDSMYFLERLCRILGFRGWDKGPLHNAADNWVSSDYFRLYPRTLTEVLLPLAWNDHEKPWYEEMLPQGCDEDLSFQIEGRTDSSNTFVELIVVRTAEKLLDVVDLKVKGCSRYSGQLMSSSQALKALSNLMICLRDMLRYAISQNDLEYFYSASSCFPSMEDPHGVWFSKEYLLRLIAVIQSKMPRQLSDNTLIGGPQSCVEDSVVTVTEMSNSLVLQISENNDINEVVVDSQQQNRTMGDNDNNVTQIYTNNQDVNNLLSICNIRNDNATKICNSNIDNTPSICNNNNDNVTIFYPELQHHNEAEVLNNHMDVDLQNQGSGYDNLQVGDVQYQKHADWNNMNAEFHKEVDSREFVNDEVSQERSEYVHRIYYDVNKNINVTKWEKITKKITSKQNQGNQNLTSQQSQQQSALLQQQAGQQLSQLDQQQPQQQQQQSSHQQQSQQQQKYQNHQLPLQQQFQLSQKEAEYQTSQQQVCQNQFFKVQLQQNQLQNNVQQLPLQQQQYQNQILQAELCQQQQQQYENNQVQSIMQQQNNLLQQQQVLWQQLQHVGKQMSYLCQLQQQCYPIPVECQLLQQFQYFYGKTIEYHNQILKIQIPQQHPEKHLQLQQVHKNQTVQNQENTLIQQYENPPSQYNRKNQTPKLGQNNNVLLQCQNQTSLQCQNQTSSQFQSQTQQQQYDDLMQQIQLNKQIQEQNQMSKSGGQQQLQQIQGENQTKQSQQQYYNPISQPLQQQHVPPNQTPHLGQQQQQNYIPSLQFLQETCAQYSSKVDSNAVLKKMQQQQQQQQCVIPDTLKQKQLQGNNMAQQLQDGDNFIQGTNNSPNTLLHQENVASKIQGSNSNETTQISQASKFNSQFEKNNSDQHFEIQTKTQKKQIQQCQNMQQLQLCEQQYDSIQQEICQQSSQGGNQQSYNNGNIIFNQQRQQQCQQQKIVQNNKNFEQKHLLQPNSNQSQIDEQQLVQNNNLQQQFGLNNVQQAISNLNQLDNQQQPDLTFQKSNEYQQQRNQIMYKQQRENRQLQQPGQNEQLQTSTENDYIKSLQQIEKDNLLFEEQNQAKLGIYFEEVERVEELQSLREVRSLWILGLQLEYQLAFQNDLMEWKKARSLRVKFEKQMDVLVMTLINNEEF